MESPPDSGLFLFLSFTILRLLGAKVPRQCLTIVTSLGKHYNINKTFLAAFKTEFSSETAFKNNIIERKRKAKF